MKERPILFSAPMVRALLDGTKTQTRRIVKPQPVFEDGGSTVIDWCPYGQPGDRLWVRETWRIGAWNEDGGEIAVDYMADNRSRREGLQVPEADDFEKYWLQCCDDCNKAGVKTDEDGKYHWEPGQSPCRVRPSIFMPRWASRITLEIIGVAAARLQDVGQQDSMEEGITGEELFLAQGYAPMAYKKLWESINGEGSWNLNPWVWVIEFKVVKS